MDPTALVTFHFKTNRNVQTVELLGSWDNFQKAYVMQHDRRRGTGMWMGCFRFDNIVCDGERMRWDKPRSGGLQQGGRYWYYYRLDLYSETFDEAAPHSLPCPLLPGQTLNVLDVPTELTSVPDRSRSFCADIAQTFANMVFQTMDPSDKFARPVPPPVSRIHTRCVSASSRKKSIDSVREDADSTKTHLAAWFERFRTRRHVLERPVSPLSPCTTSSESSKAADHEHPACADSRVVSRDGQSPALAFSTWSLNVKSTASTVHHEEMPAPSIPLYMLPESPTSNWPEHSGDHTTFYDQRPYLVTPV